MTHDFDTIIDRRHTNAVKWDIAETELPMWVADMDFATAPAITQAVLAKAAAGVFGYGIVPDEFGQAIARWWADRYHWTIEQPWIQFCDGIVPAISSLVRTLAEPGEGVVVQSPVYNCFYSSIRNSGRVVLTNDLAYAGGRFHIDWAGLDATLGDPRAKLFLLCNPQNPTGQIWSRTDLARLGELAATHHVVLVSDEIHCDITRPGSAYTPFALAAGGANSITLVSPTKSFNIPGLQTAAMIVPDADLRVRAVAGLNRDEVAEPGAFAVEAAIAAYTHGGDWLDDMRAYVWANQDYFADFVAEHLPALSVIPGQATYLAWVDCTGLTDDGTRFADFLRAQTGLIVNPGQMYGENTKGFIRVNLACPRALVEDGLTRLAAGVAAWPTALKS